MPGILSPVVLLSLKLIYDNVFNYISIHFELLFHTSIHKLHEYSVANLIRYERFPNFCMELLSGKIKNKYYEI